MAAITISAPATLGARTRRTSTSPVPAAVSATAVLRSGVATGSAPASSLRLTRRGRRLLRTVVVTVALLVALVAVVMGGVGSSQAGDSPATSATTTVVVQPGQTLWSVARGVAPGADVRDTIERIKSLNGLTGAAGDTVRPGQQLIVPAAG